MKVLICDAIAKEALGMIAEAGIEIVNKPDITLQQLIKEIHEYDAMIVRSRTTVSKPVINAATRLKVIVRGGVGLDNIDVEYAVTKGIQVLNTPAASTTAVAELTIGYIFALARQIPQMTNSMKKGEWAKKSFMGTELAGKTLGLIGVGRIGQTVGQKTNALGMKVIGYDPSVESAAGVEMIETLDELFNRADYISLHVPYTKETYKILDAVAFEKMKQGVYIVNCSRGGTIDENALYDALKNGKVAGAALDVYTEEPSRGHKLYTLEQVIGSPHVGAGTVEAIAQVGAEAARKVIHALKGVEKNGKD